MKQKAWLVLRLVIIFLLALPPALPARARIALSSTQVIYDDALGLGWDVWPWDTIVNSASIPVHSGTKSLQVTYTAGWAGVQLANIGVSTAGFTQLRFFIHGGSAGGQHINLYLKFSDNTRTEPSITLTPPLANEWSEVHIPLSSLGAQGKTITVIVFQSATAGAQPAYYLDDITLCDDPDVNGPVLSDGEWYPRAIPADGFTQVVIRARVSDPQGSGDVQSVTLDASALGRGTVTLKDDGMNNDGAGGDGMFGTVLTAPPGSPSQEVMVAVSARDQAGHVSTLRVGNLVILGSPGGSIPAALPQRFGWGTNAWLGNDKNPEAANWQVKTGVPFDYLDQYISYGWEAWENNFVYRFVNYSWAHNYIPVVTVYIMYELPPTCGESPECYISKLKNAAAVNDYLATFQRAVQQSSGTRPVIFNIEPDFYGYMQKYTNDSPPPGVIQDDPASIPVALNRRGYANTLAGFGRYLVDLIHTNAPNALAAPMACSWATRNEPWYVTAADTIQMGQRTAAFIDKMGGDQADLLVVSWSSVDAGYPGGGPWWDVTDSNLPRPTRALLWENALSAAAHKRLLIWQTPAGNMNGTNSYQSYQDNRSAYAYSHPREMFDAGVAGLVFGAGNEEQTQVWTDGGFIAAQGAIAYAAPAAPTGLRLISAIGPTVTIRWNENSEPDLWGYQVNWQRASGGSIFTLDARRKNSAVLLPAAGSWNITLRAYDAQGHLSSSSITLPVTVLENPEMLYLPVVKK